MRKEKYTKKSVLFIIFFLCFIVASLYLLNNYYINQKDKKEYDNLQQEKKQDEIKYELVEENKEFSETINKVKELQKENSDVKGWINIENTNINYPIMQTTNNDYYLTHNYKKKKAKNGSIFINHNCDIKNENSNLIIYGHNMQDGQMFQDLLNYKKKSFYETHPIIKITTEESEYDYEIIMVFKSRIFYQDEKNAFRYYHYYSFENESKYNEYINNCKKIQLYNTGKTAVYGEQLITLITCEYSQENGRMVIVAKRVNKIENKSRESI